MSTAYSSAKQQYIGNGVTTEWGFDFPIQKHSELKVYLKRSTSPQILLEEGVDYSFVTDNTITFPIKTGEAKLQATDVLALQRESVFESEYNFSNQQRLEPEEVMHADDNLERQIQELKRDVSQAIRIQPTSNINTDEYFVAVESIYENLDNINNVSGISSEIVNCSDNISDISTVSSNIANVNTVGQSISNVNTVANNISDVNTAALNIEAIKDAPNQANAASQSASDASQSATNAASSATASSNSATDSANSATSSSTSANNSHIWAEGTDAQVQALGGVHSSKVWAEQSTSVNISLTNSPYTTNRILEIPQNIKLELNNGTLTLKAGSKVYVPNGSGVFDTVTIANDTPFGVVGTANILTFVKSDGTTGNSVADNCVSGSSQPSLTYWGFWYDTANNVIKNYNGSSWDNGGWSLPLCLATAKSDSVTSIDQVFNGFGYIGSTIFGLPCIKCLVGNGRNPDGSCRTKIEESTKVSTFTMELHRLNNKIALRDGIVGVRSSLWFDEQVNMCYNNAASAYQPTAILGTFSTETTSPWNITEFNPLGVDSLVNSNASNFSQAGRSYLSGLGMPSGRYIDLTLGASGSTYTAPANGWVALAKKTSAVNQYIYLSQLPSQTSSQCWCPLSGQYAQTYIPVRKGRQFTANYSAGGDTAFFKFIYAEGEN